MESDTHKAPRKKFSSLGTDVGRNSLATILVGLGLKEDEIQLFENENIGAETFMSLSDEDLLQMGIKDILKRKSIMKIVLNLRKRGTMKQEEVKRPEPLSKDDVSSVVANNSQRMSMLHGMIRLLYSQQKHHKGNAVDGFLDKEWTCSRALLACTAAAVSQSECVCKELESLQLMLGGNGDHKERWYRKQNIVKLLASLGVIGGGFLFWRSLKELVKN